MRPALYGSILRLKIDEPTKQEVIALARREGLDTSSFVRNALKRLARDAAREQQPKARANG